MCAYAWMCVYVCKPHEEDSNTLNQLKATEYGFQACKYPYTCFKEHLLRMHYIKHVKAELFNL